MKKELKKVIKDYYDQALTDEFIKGAFADERDEGETETLFNAIEGIANFWVIDRDNKGGDYWTELHYFSNKLQKTIIFDNDFYRTDIQTVDKFIEFVIERNKEVAEFENNIVKTTA